MRQKELIDIYILEILSKHASEKKPMFQKKVKDYLVQDYELKVSRKTLGTYIAYLRDMGYIKGQRGIYKVNTFSDNELRILIDSVLYAQYIPAGEAKNLISKLKELSPLSLKNKARNTHYVQAINRTQNENLYLVLDALDEAIEHNKKVKITRCLYNEQGELEDIGPSIIHPYYIVTSNARYYIICGDDSRKTLENRRLDRISKVEILQEVRKPLREFSGEEFNLSQYMREHVYMFSGKSIPIEIKMPKKYIGFFIDWYGHEYTSRPAKDDEDYIIIRTMNNENATYYWALQYGGMVEVLAPLALRKRIKVGLQEILGKYESTHR